MTPQKAQEYLGQTCRVNYITRLPSWKPVIDEYGIVQWEKYISKIPHSRTGVITNITVRKLIMLAFDGGDDFEYYIRLKNIKQIYELKP